MFLIIIAFCVNYLGLWGCWTEWSPCTVSCGVGQKTRTRECLTEGSGESNDISCDGPDAEFETCEMPNCDCKLTIL